MIKKDDVKMIKLLIDFASKSIDNKRYSFSEFVEGKLTDEEEFLLSYNLEQLLNKIQKIENEIKESEEEKLEELKPLIAKILGSMIEDGELRTTNIYDYDGEYIGLEINDGDKYITSKYNSDNALIEKSNKY